MSPRTWEVRGCAAGVQLILLHEISDILYFRDQDRPPILAKQHRQARGALVLALSGP